MYVYPKIKAFALDCSIADYIRTMAVFFSIPRNHSIDFTENELCSK